MSSLSTSDFISSGLLCRLVGPSVSRQWPPKAPRPHHLLPTLIYFPRIYSMVVLFRILQVPYLRRRTTIPSNERTPSSFTVATRTQPVSGTRMRFCSVNKWMISMTCLAGFTIPKGLTSLRCLPQSMASLPECKSH